MDTNPAAGSITSSADRMVGADHAEVRYFTRFVDFVGFKGSFSEERLTVFYSSYDHHGIFHFVIF